MTTVARSEKIKEKYRRFPPECAGALCSFIILRVRFCAISLLEGWRAAEQPEKAELIRLTKGATLVVPSSVHWEVGNALSEMFKRKAIGLDDALKVLDAYSGIPIRLMEGSLRQAVELSARLNIYAYDAYVIACAVNRKAPILTLDGGLIERARA